VIRILFGIFIVLHGLVHLLYFGQSARYFELQPGLVWPDGAWVLSGYLGAENIRKLASILLVDAALIFLVGGVGVFIKQGWWRFIVIFGAIFSTVSYFLLWNGKFERLADNGWVGILINLVVLAALLLFKWPTF